MRGDFSRVTFDAARRHRGVLLQQGRVLLDADFNEQAAIVLEELRLFAHHTIGDHGGPAADLGFGLQHLDLAAGDFAIGAGAYYVQGALCVNASAALTYRRQPGLAASGSIVRPFDPSARYVVYLEAWEREVSSVEDPGLREAALNGDTCWRSRIEWLVKVRAEDEVVAPSNAHLRARLAPPDGRYHGAENRLYRVEIHEASPNGPPLCKWSRDNGSAVFGIEAVAGSAVRLSGNVSDARAFPTLGSYVEVLDDARAASGASGELLEVTDVDLSDAAITLARPAPELDAAGHPRLVRWDGAATVREGDGPAPDWIDLEAGIQIQFGATDGASQYRPGDYWLVPARESGSTIEWPDGEFRPTLARRFAADIAAIDGGRLGDLRKAFAPLAR